MPKRIPSPKDPEKTFADNATKKLKNLLPADAVSSGECILYQLSIDPDGKLIPENYLKPIRGQFAFQTDILIKNQKVPLVVVETKIHNPTTHDILTYSTKALRHKGVYPYLRYGLLILSTENKIDNKFFVHNVGFDFALAVKDPNDSMTELADLIKVQNQASAALQSGLGNRVVRKHSTTALLS